MDSTDSSGYLSSVSDYLTHEYYHEEDTSNEGTLDPKQLLATA